MPDTPIKCPQCGEEVSYVAHIIAWVRRRVLVGNGDELTTGDEQDRADFTAADYKKLPEDVREEIADLDRLECPTCGWTKAADQFMTCAECEAILDNLWGHDGLCASCADRREKVRDA